MFQIFMVICCFVICNISLCFYGVQSFWTPVMGGLSFCATAVFTGLPRLQLSFLGISQQWCSHTLLWWFGQTLAGPRMEDGMDPHPRPEWSIRTRGMPPVPVLVTDYSCVPPRTHAVCHLRRSVRVWWSWASVFWVRAASSKVLWRASSTTRLKAFTATPLAS